jgi:hypothetical protein
MSSVVSISIRPVSDMPADIRGANNLGADGFVEIKVENSEPTVTMTKIASPSKRFKDLLKEKGVTVKF